MKRPCVGARCREYCFGPLPRAPERPGPVRGRKVARKYESRHLAFSISGGRFFRGKRRPRRAPPAAPCLLTLVVLGDGAVLILLCVNILCRRSGGQALCRANNLQPRGRAIRRGLGKSSARKPSPSPTDALKRLMHDDAAGIYWQGTRSNHREESSEPSAASHDTSAAPPSSDAAMRPLLETRALSGEPSKVFIPGADCFPGACVRSFSHMAIAWHSVTQAEAG